MGAMGAEPPPDSHLPSDALDQRLRAWGVDEKSIGTVLGACKPRRIQSVLSTVARRCRTREVANPAGLIIRLALDSSRAAELTPIGIVNRSIRKKRASTYTPGAKA
jgi:hypothetical protein